MRDLAQNNNREWFEAHTATYREAVQAPAMALVATLGRALAAEFPPIGYDTRANGGSLMRIHRDTRFSADKTPYKSNIAMMFAPAGRKRMEAPGFGMQITLDQIDLVAGQFAFGPQQLDRYRAAVVAEEPGRALEAAVARVLESDPSAVPGGLAEGVSGRGTAGAGDGAAYRLGEPDLKRAPRGFDPDHPRATWLRYKGLPVFSPPLPLPLARTPQLVDAVMAHFRAMAPVWFWLTEHVAG